MLTQIIGVDKLKERYLVQGVQEYAKRLAPYVKFQVLEVANEIDTLGTYGTNHVVLSSA